MHPATSKIWRIFLWLWQRYEAPTLEQCVISIDYSTCAKQKENGFTKGQLISKRFFEAVDFLQKTNENKSIWVIIVVSRIRSVVFWRKLMTIDEINWPLEKLYIYIYRFEWTHLNISTFFCSRFVVGAQFLITSHQTTVFLPVTKELKLKVWWQLPDFLQLSEPETEQTIQSTEQCQ